MAVASASDAALLQEVREYIDFADDSPSSQARLQALLQSASSFSSSSSSSSLSTLRSLFTPRIAFGTAGLRARMDDGYHNINSVVITQTTQGLLRYLQQEQPQLLTSEGVVVGYDGRHHSQQWAQLTTAIFLSQSVPVLLFSSHCPTPLVPFTIRQLGLACGVMVTASHNPACDNGYKLYWSNSAQIIPPRDAHISSHIEQQHQPWQRFTLDRQHPLLSDPLHDMQQRYQQLITQYCWRREHNQKTALRVTYTAMHGVGAPWAAKAFESAHAGDRASHVDHAARSAADILSVRRVAAGRSACRLTFPCPSRSSRTRTSPPCSSPTQKRAQARSPSPSASQTRTVADSTGSRTLCSPASTSADRCYCYSLSHPLQLLLSSSPTTPTPTAWP